MLFWFLIVTDFQSTIGYVSYVSTVSCPHCPLWNQEAEREVDIAERHLKDSQLKLRFLQGQLQEHIISGIGGLKVAAKPAQVEAYKPPENENEAERKARVRRRWRVLGMKIKFGLGAQSLATKKRNLADASTFIEKESEVCLNIHLSFFIVCTVGGFQRRPIGPWRQMLQKESRQKIFQKRGCCCGINTWKRQLLI